MHNNSNIIDSLRESRDKESSLGIAAPDAPLDLIESLNNIISDSNNYENYRNCLEILVRHSFDYSEDGIVTLFEKIGDETINEETRDSYLTLLNVAMKNPPTDFELPKGAIRFLCDIFPNTNAFGIVAKLINMKISHMNAFLSCFGGKRKCFKKLNDFMISYLSSDYVSDELFELFYSICSYKMILIQLIPLFLETINNMIMYNIHFQIKGFELINAFCDGQVIFVRMLLKNENLNKLFERINEDKELLEKSLKFACSVVKICDDIGFFVNDTKILEIIDFKNQQMEMKTLGYLFCILSYFIEEKEKEGINYIFELNIINEFVGILDTFSFSILQKFIQFINIIISKGTINHIVYIMQIPEIIRQIADYTLQIDDESKYYNLISNIFETFSNFIQKTRNKYISSDVLNYISIISENNQILDNFLVSISSIYNVS